MSETDDEIAARIRASIERDMANPEWVAHMRHGLEDMRAGRFMSWRVALLPLPFWVRAVISRIVDRKWRRSLKNVIREADANK